MLRDDAIQCCVKGCGTWMKRRSRGARPEFCPEHGISVSTSPTYILSQKSRNIIVGQDLFERVTIGGNKVENWRLGYETSEDAVSWNVFVGLQTLHGLKEAVAKLTGVAVVEEPELYLWGNRINAQYGKWQELQRVRDAIETHLSIPTEPDIILRVPGKLIALIEAKFGSPNGTLARKEARFGSVTTYLNRYAPKNGCPDPLERRWIEQQEGKAILEQLCRNVVFSQWLAAEGEQAFMINLVRRASNDDAAHFQKHLSGNGVQFFRRTWEDLFGLNSIQSMEGALLRAYMQNKTLRLARAFDCA